MEGLERFHAVISVAGYAIETFGVLIVVTGAVTSTIGFVRHYQRLPDGQAYQAYRRHIGRAIILGLEFLIAGDIIRTVIIADSLNSIAMLTLIVFLRSFLSVTLHLDVEGRWPWTRSGDAELQRAEPRKRHKEVTQ